jgi:hypothetical protein
MLHFLKGFCKASVLYFTYVIYLKGKCAKLNNKPAYVSNFEVTRLSGKYKLRKSESTLTETVYKN